MDIEKVLGKYYSRQNIAEKKPENILEKLKEDVGHLISAHEIPELEERINVTRLFLGLVNDDIYMIEKNIDLDKEAWLPHKKLIDLLMQLRRAYIVLLQKNVHDFQSPADFESWNQHNILKYTMQIYPLLNV